MKLQDIAEELLLSYKNEGGINYKEGTDLPSRKGVIKFLGDVRTLLFPGYHEESGLDSHTIPYTITETLNRAARDLLLEVERAIKWGCTIKDCTKGKAGCRDEANDILIKFFIALPHIRTSLLKDIEAAFLGDPAAKSRDEVILSYPAVEAIMVYRIAHFFWINQVPLIPRMMSEYAHSLTGIDIHPGAKIGDSFFIDHGTGTVIGETTVIGNNVKLYQGVTLGALSVRKEESETKRHPTIEDNVTIYAGATILGGKTVIGLGSIIGGNTWITETVAPNSIIYNANVALNVKSAK